MEFWSAFWTYFYIFLDVIFGRYFGLHYSLYRILGDFLHLFARGWILYRFFKKDKLALESFSKKTQLIHTVAYTLRLFCSDYSHANFYDWSVNILLFVIMAATTAFVIYGPKYNTEKDEKRDCFQVPIVVMYCSCFTLLWNSSWSAFEGYAYFFHNFPVPELDTRDGLWSLSIYLESLGIIPQLYHLIQNGTKDPKIYTGDVQQILVNFLYFKRFLYIFHHNCLYWNGESIDGFVLIMCVAQFIVFIVHNARKMYIIQFWNYAEQAFYASLNHFDGVFESDRLALEKEEAENANGGCQDSSCNHDHGNKPVAKKKCEDAKCQDPKCEKPKVEAKKSEHAKCEDPKCEAPKVDAPKCEAPKVEAPKCEDPKCEDSNCEQHAKVKNAKAQNTKGGGIDAKGKDAKGKDAKGKDAKGGSQLTKRRKKKNQKGKNIKDLLKNKKNKGQQAVPQKDSKINVDNKPVAANGKKHVD